MRGYLHKSLSATMEFIIGSEKSTGPIILYSLFYYCLYVKALSLLSVAHLRQFTAETGFSWNGLLLYYAGHTKTSVTSGIKIRLSNFPPSYVYFTISCANWKNIHDNIKGVNLWPLMTHLKLMLHRPLTGIDTSAYTFQSFCHINLGLDQILLPLLLLHLGLFLKANHRKRTSAWLGEGVVLNIYHVQFVPPSYMGERNDHLGSGILSHKGSDFSVYKYFSVYSNARIVNNLFTKI